MPPKLKVNADGEIITCIIPKCKQAPVARGWCDKHYRRWLRGGNPNKVKNSVPTYEDPIERFWRWVDKTGPLSPLCPELGPCWLWTGGLSEKGYARFAVTRDWERSNWAVHRFSYELMVGTIADGLELDHLCNVRHCVNPDHLDPVTHEENIQRAVNRGSYLDRPKKTHCPQGHEYNETNTRIESNGYGKCRVCDAARQRQRRCDRIKVATTAIGVM